MTSGSTREFMALCAIAQHFGRPGTPTDQAWIESLFGHVKGEWPHLDLIEDPAVLRAEGVPVDLRDALGGLDATNSVLVAQALAHAAGHGRANLAIGRDR